MIDFLMVSTRNTKHGIEIYPKFILKKSSDLMIRGGDFYAIWIAEIGLWSTDEQDALQLIDKELDRYFEENKDSFVNVTVKILHMWDSENRMIDHWHRYCQKDMRDNFHMLDEKLIFSNMKTKKTDYASKRLPYPLESCETPAYDNLMSTLYSDDERHKIEWAIGSIVCGDSKTLQKFVVLYGAAGTGKSTVLNIIQQLFDGYYSVFDARALGSSSNSFALEAFKSNPLVAIQHDGDLSHIEDNTRINSLVSHEYMTVNEKFHSAYSNRFKCFLFMGTNKPVRITDSKSGLIRRLIDVSPSGNKLSGKEYKSAVNQIKFELGGIATHCQEVYLANPGAYDDYIPVAMLSASNDFYNYVIDSAHVFEKSDGVTLKAAWEMYKVYCDEAKVAYPFSQRIFKEELRTYFRDYYERMTMEDGTRVRSYYSGFKTERFTEKQPVKVKKRAEKKKLILNCTESVLDKVCADCYAQYASKDGIPSKSWDKVRTKLSSLDTSKLHYVRVPENHIVIDFDIPDEDGNKSLEKNLEAAAKFPPTYAELSKSGCGVHLHYIYAGDVSELNPIYSDHVEIKVFKGKSALRRQLTKCNDLDISTISSGLPLLDKRKGDKSVVNSKTIKSERGLREFIKRNLNKEIHASTKSSIDFINKGLEDAYNSGMTYDVSDMHGAILSFAAGSTNQSKYCINLVSKMKFKSNDEDLPFSEMPDESKPIVFYDVEVFPNLFVVCWKYAGEDKKVVRMINPSAESIEEFIMAYRLIGFNCRKYDNHILYARMMGYSNEQLYKLSQKIVSGKNKECFFREAYDISYTDIYDFSSTKQSLKKFEIELGIHHQEAGLPWDQPVDESLWPKIAEYCENDVIATEAVFNSPKRQADFTARKILAAVARMTVNDTTNTLTTRIIFGNERHPQSSFNYRDMGKVPKENVYAVNDYMQNKNIEDGNYTVFDMNGRPYFPHYKFEAGVSTYRGEEVGEGGYVYAEPGMYGHIALLDIASMHPSSIVAENLFGMYTERFQDILNARIAIKHRDFKSAKKMLNGELAPYLTDEKSADDLAKALKIAINSVYGLTAASFDNPFRDPRNVDNIVAKRGALFMINLKHEVQKRGFTVAHIKTDSIKIPDANLDIIDFVINYGKLYGYNFEHEATYDRMCLVNNAVYVAKYATVEKCCELYGEKYVNSDPDMLKDNKKHPGEWTATGAQFQVPYVFKTIFSGEDIEFSDLCETKSVQTALYLDFNETLPDVSDSEKELDKLEHDYKHGKVSDTTFEKRSCELDAKIAKGHNYCFVGKVGLFTPVKSGTGGGLLMRENKGKFGAATGAKGYRWLESEMVKALGKEDDIDRSYFDNMVDEAIKTIVAYGDYKWFVSDRPYFGPNFEMGLYMNQPVYEEELPFN